jgi:hypothetical protein
MTSAEEEINAAFAAHAEGSATTRLSSFPPSTREERGAASAAGERVAVLRVERADVLMIEARLVDFHHGADQVLRG